MGKLHEFSARSIDGGEVPLAGYAGRVLLIVNTASRCGFTGQYGGLESLHRALGPRGFSVLAFPCNQFAHQEPGSSEEIAAFCRTRYDVTFPVFERIDVNGSAAHPLFAFLKQQRRGLLGSGTIKWNFTKFLVDAGGRVRERFGPAVTPERIRPVAERLLAAA